MAVPEYFRRNAVAVSQALSGLDEQLLQSRLRDVCIGVTVGTDARTTEGQATLDLLVRLLARLYPALAIRDEENGEFATKLRQLAQRINPRIDLLGEPTVEVIIGSAQVRPSALRTVFVGSRGWTAKLSTRGPQECGNSNNPFGAGLAACLVAADVFRHVFLPATTLCGDFEFRIPPAAGGAHGPANVEGNVGNLVLVGAGAIGNGAVWALSRAGVQGSIDIVDHESVDLGNLQRYVLTERKDEKKPKAQFLVDAFSGSLTADAHECTLAEFLPTRRHRVDNLLLALDSARDRRAAQASLPRRVGNAWTQPNDLGVSSHDFLRGACVSCLYLPNGTHKNQDEIVAGAFGVPDRLMQVRDLLHRNAGAPRDLLEAIATALNLPLQNLMVFEHRSLWELYTEGFCGGAVIPLGESGRLTNDVHVPLAHQSAMAGLLLAAVGVAMGAGARVSSVVTQYDVLKPQERFQVYPVAKDDRGICVCQDPDYVDIYRQKYGLSGDG